MGAMKDHLIDLMSKIENRRFSEVLETLSPWGEDAPNQLWAVVEYLAADNPPELPSHYLPWGVRQQRLTPQDLRDMAQFLEQGGYLGVNLALALDLLARDFSREE